MGFTPKKHRHSTNQSIEVYIIKQREMDINRAIVVVVCIMAGFIIGAGFRNCVKQEPRVVEIEKHDTVTIRDTLRIRERTKPKYVIRHDTLWLPTPEIYCDSTDYVCDGRVIDSIPVDIPIMQSEYRDTIANDSSRAEIKVLFSGYNAQIDEIGINYHAYTQTRVERKKNGWGQFVGIGVGVGYGASVVGQRIYASPEIGLHITYGWGYHW